MTPHFTLAELTRSDTAKRLRLDNMPAGADLERLRGTAQMLERIRAHLGCPVIVTSGYRSRAVNSAVGGVSSSDHMTGQAADIVVPAFGTPYEVAKALAPHVASLRIGQLIYEVNGKSKWLHVSQRAPAKTVNRVITIKVGKGAMLGIQDV